jgi:hypothetical protein
MAELVLNLIICFSVSLLILVVIYILKYRLNSKKNGQEIQVMNSSKCAIKNNQIFSSEDSLNKGGIDEIFEIRRKNIDFSRKKDNTKTEFIKFIKKKNIEKCYLIDIHVLPEIKRNSI